MAVKTQNTNHEATRELVGAWFLKVRASWVSYLMSLYLCFLHCKRGA